MPTKKQITRKILAAEEAIRQCTAHLGTIRKELDGMSDAQRDALDADLGAVAANLEEAEDDLEVFGSLEENPTDEDEDEDENEDEL